MKSSPEESEGGGGEYGGGGASELQGQCPDSQDSITINYFVFKASAFRMATTFTLTKLHNLKKTKSALVIYQSGFIV